MILHERSKKGLTATVYRRSVIHSQPKSLSFVRLYSQPFVPFQDNPLKFDFIDPPPRRAVSNALELLYALSALDEEMNLTTVGKEMSTLPLPPMLARSVLEAKRLACLPQMLSLVAMLSVEVHERSHTASYKNRASSCP